MFARFIRSLIALVVVAGAYQAYALLVAPVVEPVVVRKATTASTEAERNLGRNAVARYQELLAHYFPADHWSLTGSPKVLESGPVMLVIEDYKKDDRGRVDLIKCAAIMFPTRRRSDAPPPRDAVVFEAPGGARLKFDENFQPSRGKVGRIIRGEFPGPVTIRSQMRDPGPDDDLLITTRDVQIDQSRIFTPHEVKIRHGRSSGGGRRLEIRLIEEEHARGKSGLNIAGVESIEIVEAVKLELDLGAVSPLQSIASAAPIASTIRLTAFQTDNELDDEAAAWADSVAPEVRSAQPGQDTTMRAPHASSIYARPDAAESRAWAAGAVATGPTLPNQRASNQRGSNQRGSNLPAANRPPPRQPPVQVTCAGSFHMDLTNFVATFRDNVYAWQLNLDGQSDQLTCQKLQLFFGAGDARDQVQLDPRNEPDLANRQRRTLAQLEPRRLEAVGDPVRVDSPSQGASARGQNLTFDILRRQLTLDGGRTMISHGANFVEAPIIRYQHPAEDDPAAIGQMWVAGPGRLRAIPKDEQPDEVIEARWDRAQGVEFPVRLTRNDAGQPLLTVLGRPRITAAGIGRIESDRLSVLLAETEEDGKEGPAIELGKATDGGKRRALLPERIDAAGHVEVQSPRLTAATDSLTVWMLEKMAAAPTSGATATDASATRAGANQGKPKRTTHDANKPTYRLEARRAQLEVAMSGRRSEPITLSCDGQVNFREISPRAGEQPLQVLGERLRVDNLDTDAVRLTIHGNKAGVRHAPGQGAAARDASALATIKARGVTLHAVDAHLDQAKNRMWADGPGDAHVQTRRDFLGQQTDAATDLHLRWRGGWVFDGRQMTIRDNVIGDGPHDWIRTNELVATLSRPVTFGKSIDASAEEIEIKQIECRGGVTLDHRSIDPLGQRSHERAQLATLSVNQQTGELSGTGPGWIRSVHLAEGGNPLAGLAGGQPRKRPLQQVGAQAGASGARLRLLRVHFQGALLGNYKSRQMEFQQRVRAVYGPVIAWQQDLPVHMPDALPPDTATLACDKLRVHEDPLARYTGSATPRAGSQGLAQMGPIELQAIGGVRLEGADDKGGTFNAQAGVASFNQMKELFALEGAGRTRATLWLRKGPGEGVVKHSSGKVAYWRKTGRVQTENFGATDYTPTAGRPPAPQR